MSQYAATRFGQDSYARIATSAEMLLEASAVMPYEPMYQPLVSFMPPSITTGGSGTTVGGAAALAALEDSGPAEYKQYPDRLDLYVYQGDDVQIPLYFTNPGDPALDMSNENGWSWKAEIKVYHRYMATVLNTFSIESESVPPTPPSVTPTGQTLVTLFLPRMHNQYIGVYQWELMSYGPYDGPVFPKPPDVDAADWPMTDFVKTWLYGYFYVVPRETSTDWLPVPANAVTTGQTVAIGSQGWGLAPNGRVP